MTNTTSTRGWLRALALVLGLAMVAAACGGGDETSTDTGDGTTGTGGPRLAESIEPNEDFTSWTITLPEGVTFHDGTPLDAQVVANNIDAYRGAYENRSPLLFRFVFQDVSSVEVVDPLTVQVAMARPWSAFDWALYGSNRIGIMGQAQLDSDDCGNELVGTQLPYLDRLTYQPIPDVAGIWVSR